MIEKITGLAASLFAFACSNAQQSYLHPATLGLHVILNGFQTRNFFGKTKTMDAGLSVNYVHGISPRYDYDISCASSFPADIKSSRHGDQKSLFLQTDAQLRVRAFKKERAIQPFFSFGPGLYSFKGSNGIYVSSGLGLAFHYRDVYLESKVQYHVSSAHNMPGHFLYSIGIAGVVSRPVLKRKKLTVSATVAKAAGDRDGDGILDSVDLCPDKPGVAVFHGCPDTDGDGIEDKLDNCPIIPGIARYQGCPVPDTDRDGLNDEVDSCVFVAGAKQNQGCPVQAEGFHTIEFAARNIYFETGSDILLASSFASLDTIVIVLNQNPAQHIRIEGHTDNVGTEEKNQKLSEGRALSVKNYLVQKGVDAARLSTAGYGATRPVDTNETAEGRSKNRRVVFIVNK